MMTFFIILSLILSSRMLQAAANKIYPINSPYTKSQITENILFSNFNEPPKHLDPAKSYSSDEAIFTGQIYEPPYQYHYLLRPYRLIPLSADGYIAEQYFDKDNNELEQDANIESIAYTVYTIKIKPNILYQPHPCFVKDSNNNYRYHNLDINIINKLDNINDIDYSLTELNKTNTRELIAADFIYQIKRLADPKINSPIFSFMSKHIVGLGDLNKDINVYRNKLKSQMDNADSKSVDSELDNKYNNNNYLDLNIFELDGVKLIDKYTYQIKITGKYPQFKYWMAMPFFAPIPWEADRFYSQEGLNQQNISLDTFPVGTGPYMLMDNNPNRKMVLEKNPNYTNTYYPKEGMPGDKEKGLLDNAGKPLPLIDKIEFYLEKESIPIWNKFLQGYYDTAGISSDNFDQAIELVNNKLSLSDEMLEKDIKLQTSVQPSIYYWAFNMLDNVVGGYDEKNRKLRQAIGIIFDVEEYLNIFRNGRGIVAHSPIPPGISVIENKFNQYLYKDKNNKKNLQDAKKLLSEAGYENGIDPKTGAPLVINFDTTTSGDPSEGALYNWMREQFDKLNLKLNIRTTQYNRFRDKMSSGKAQMYFWGWLADYPDPENFLFLFLCAQSKVKFHGENASNYCNNDFDELFDKMQSSNIISEKQEYIKQMVTILQQDAPWLFGFFGESFVLRHGWMDPSKPFAVGNNNLKYLSLNPSVRLAMQSKWNQPKIWPVLLFLLFSIMLLAPVMYSYYQKLYRTKVRV